MCRMLEDKCEVKYYIFPLKVTVTYYRNTDTGGMWLKKSLVFGPK